MLSLVRAARSALRVTSALKLTRLSARTVGGTARTIPELLAATPTMEVTELREELDKVKVDHSDCEDVGSMRNRLLTVLRDQAYSEAQMHMMNGVPAAYVAIAPAWTGLTREALCIIPAWDFERAQEFYSREPIENLNLESARSNIADHFARKRRELLMSSTEHANMVASVLVALLVHDADGVRMVSQAEVHGENGFDKWHVPVLMHASPVPSTWRVPDLRRMGLSDETKIAEVEAAVANVRLLLGEPEQPVPENDVLEAHSTELRGPPDILTYSDIDESEHPAVARAKGKGGAGFTVLPQSLLDHCVQDFRAFPGPAEEWAIQLDDGSLVQVREGILQCSKTADPKTYCWVPMLSLDTFPKEVLDGMRPR